MEVSNFLDRFYFFCDSVIRNIEVSFRNITSPTIIKVIISVRDKQATKNDDWVNVEIKISEVIEFNLQESFKESYQVISHGLHILESDERIYFDFGFHIDPPNISEEFKESNFYVVGKQFDYKVEN